METGGDEGLIERVVDSKDLQQQSKAFDKLTDRVEDRQLDSTRVQEAMASIAASSEADWNAMKMREKELAAVKIKAADVDIIANELELDPKVAERTLLAGGSYNNSVCFSEMYQSPGQLIQICFGADESCFTQYQKRVKILKTIYHFRPHGLSGFGTKSRSAAWPVLVFVTSASNPKVSYEVA
nr:huntingtin-interacting protein k [Quercus suber]